MTGEFRSSSKPDFWRISTLKQDQTLLALPFPRYHPDHCPTSPIVFGKHTRSTECDAIHPPTRTVHFPAQIAPSDEGIFLNPDYLPPCPSSDAPRHRPTAADVELMMSGTTGGKWERQDETSVMHGKALALPVVGVEAPQRFCGKANRSVTGVRVIVLLRQVSENERSEDGLLIEVLEGRCGVGLSANPPTLRNRSSRWYGGRDSAKKVVRTQHRSVVGKDELAVVYEDPVPADAPPLWLLRFRQVGSSRLAGIARGGN
ncbi:hypothetical protein R3P38DRAFT_3207251 [Favolaschia claudopus]|uniref:Uncharacterized protein n=1 Tax=Favolaschia claudopus TaxID=2862362 RepID=A0AAW0AK89_9AGAR